MRTFPRWSVVVHVLCLVGPLSAGADPAPKPAAGEVLQGVDRSKLVVVADGKDHFIAYLPDKAGQAFTLYSGDAKDLWQVPVISYAGSGAKEFSSTFWEPRVARP